MKNLSKYYSSLLLLVILSVGNDAHSQVQRMYVGTYTSGSESKGVYVYDFDESTGKADFVQNIAMSNPSFLARKGDMLYAVNEDAEGMVSAYNLKTNEYVSHVSSGGVHPCHIAISPRDPIVVVSNYSSGSLSLLSLTDNGSINQMDDFIKFNGSSINPARQKESHIHSAFFSKDGSKVFVSDLGADLIYVFEIKEDNGKYKFQKVQDIKTKLGGGPRHLVFSKDEKSLYSILEMTGEVEVFQVKNEQWSSKQVLPMYPADFKGEHGGADIKLSADGKVLYATNRGTANVLFAYKVKSNGFLKLRNWTSVFGDSPRNLNLSPKGKFVLVSNQNTNNVSIFPFSLKNVRENKQELNIPKPVCVIF